MTPDLPSTRTIVVAAVLAAAAWALPPLIPTAPIWVSVGGAAAVVAYSAALRVKASPLSTLLVWLVTASSPVDAAYPWVRVVLAVAVAAMVIGVYGYPDDVTDAEVID